MKLGKISFILFVICFAAGAAFAGNVTFQAKVDKNLVSLGESVQLELTFYGTQNVEAPELPEIDGFQSSYIGPSTMVSIVNGEVSSSITHNYVLLPLKVGKFTIGPFAVRYRGKTYKSQPIDIQVIRGVPRGTPRMPPQAPLPRRTPLSPQQKPRVNEDELRDRIFVQLDVDKKQLYLNEEADVYVRLFVNDLAVRDIEYPKLDADGFSVGQFDKPRQYERVVGGIRYNVIEFKTRLFGVKAGLLELGPAKVKCNLVLRQRRKRKSRSIFDDFFDDDFFDDFFTSYRTYPLELKSMDIPIEVSGFPEEGRPEGFTGAVGHFRLDVKASPKDVNVGDPITVKMRITGKGNFSSVQAPKINAGEEFKVYEPQGKEGPDEKTFDEVLVPKTDNLSEIPEAEFSYFDTAAGKYETVHSAPIPITVRPAPKGERVEIVEAPSGGGEAKTIKEKFGRDIVYIKDSLGSIKTGKDLYRNRIFLFLQFLPLLTLLVSAAYARRKRRYVSDIRYARLKRAPKAARQGLAKARRLMKEGKEEEFYAAIYETLRSYIGDRFHIPSGGITVDTIDERLKGEGVPEEVLGELKKVFCECDMVRFGRTGGDMRAFLGEAEAVIAKVEKLR